MDAVDAHRDDGGPRGSIRGVPHDVALENRRLVPWVCVIVLAIVLTGLLIPMPFHGRLSSALGDLCHFPVFFVVTTTALWGWQRLLPYASMSPRHIWNRRIAIVERMWVRVCVAVVIATVFGVGMEYLQSHFSRSASWHDARANFLGCLCAGIVHASRWLWRFRGRTMYRRWGLALAVCGGLVASLRPASIVHDVWAVGGRFPLLAGFETEIEWTRWFPRHCEIVRSTRNVTEGRYAGEIRVGPLPDPAPEIAGVTLHRMGFDWSSMTRLRFDLWVDASTDYPPRFRIKVVDEVPALDREGGERLINHTEEFVLEPGRHREVTIDRKTLVDAGVDLRHVRFLDIHIVRPPGPAVYRIDHVRLELSDVSVKPES